MAIEEPNYDVVKEYDDFELRQYAPMLVAETRVTGRFDEVGNQAFRILAGYIGGNNTKAAEISMTAPVNQQPLESQGEGEKIEMTAPVIQSPAVVDGSSEIYILSFVMPSSYTKTTLPTPTDQRVQIREVPGRLVAARKYRGGWSQEKYQEHEQTLLKAIQAAGYAPVGKPIFARYNPPFMPSIFRRNEVLIEVKNNL